MQQRMPIPDRIKNAPKLLAGLELYYEAYEELASFCNANPARPPILWADVNEYAKVNSFSEDQRYILMRCVVEMEITAIQFRQSKGKTNGGNAPKTVIPKDTRAKQASGRKR